MILVILFTTAIVFTILSLNTFTSIDINNDKNVFSVPSVFLKGETALMELQAFKSVVSEHLNRLDSPPGPAVILNRLNRLIDDTGEYVSDTIDRVKTVRKKLFNPPIGETLMITREKLLALRTLGEEWGALVARYSGEGVFSTSVIFDALNTFVKDNSNLLSTQIRQRMLVPEITGFDDKFGKLSKNFSDIKASHKSPVLTDIKSYVKEDLPKNKRTLKIKMNRINKNLISINSALKRRYITT